MKILIPAAVFLTVFTTPYIVKKFPLLPDNIGYAPDVVIALAGALILMRLVAMRRMGNVPLRYWLTMAGFCYVVAAGFMINDVPPDVAFAGIRMFFKYVPLFLLPFVYEYSEKDLKRLFWLLFGVLLLQIPVTFHQRFVEYAGVATGDVVTGTLEVAASVVFLVVVVVLMIAALLLRGYISFRQAALMGLVALVPATLNSTRVTPILIGVGIGLVAYFEQKRINARQYLVIAVVCGALLSAFVLVYDKLYGERVSYLSFMSSTQSTMDNYNFTGVRGGKFEPYRERPELVDEPVTDYTVGGKVSFRTKGVEIGRVDSVIIPFDMLFPEHLERLMFGLGIGNTNSDFGEGGRYVGLSKQIGGSTTELSFFIWEVGLLGLTFYLMFVFFVLRDAAFVSKESASWGVLGLSMRAYVFIWLICLIYKSAFVGIQSAAALFFFLCGLVIARAGSIRIAQASAILSSAPNSHKSS